MIKKTVYVLLLLGAVVAVVFATINRPNTHTLLPLKAKQSIEIIESDSLTNESDSLEISVVKPLE